MTATQTVIQDAIAGGFHKRGISILEASLNPAFWQALGRSRGWNPKVIECQLLGTFMAEWQTKWYWFAIHLETGDDYETAFGKLD